MYCFHATYVLSDAKLHSPSLSAFRRVGLSKEEGGRGENQPTPGGGGRGEGSGHAALFTCSTACEYCKLSKKPKCVKQCTIHLIPPHVFPQIFTRSLSKPDEVPRGIGGKTPNTRGREGARGGGGRPTQLHSTSAGHVSVTNPTVHRVMPVMQYVLFATPFHFTTSMLLRSARPRSYMTLSWHRGSGKEQKKPRGEGGARERGGRRSRRRPHNAAQSVRTSH